MYAVIKTGGKQYKVAAGEKIKVELLDAEVGAEVTIDQVLAVGNGGELKIGAPLVAGVMLWLTSQKDVMGEHVNGIGTTLLGAIGLLILLLMAVNTARKLPTTYQNYREKQRAQPEQAAESFEHSPRASKMLAL